jgi:hypothetical protein
MSDPNAKHDAAIQYLVWAIDEIEKSGDQRAARHARAALKSLQETPSRVRKLAAFG